MAVADPTAIAPGLPPRQLAWRVLQAVAAGAYADGALERELGRQRLSPADRGLATELAYGAIRQRRLLDAWIDALGRRPAERQPPALRWLLHVGLYQLLFCRRVPAAAAVTTSVELAKAAGLARLAPVVNGLLRGVLRRHDGGPEPWSGLELPHDPVAAFGLRHSLPDWIAAALLRWQPQNAETIAAAANRPPPLDLRVNPCRTSRLAQLEAFAAAGIGASPLADQPLGLTLPGGCGDLRQLPGYAEGHWSVQDRTAQRLVPLLAPRPGERLLDACAAPGGKATQIAEQLAGPGTLWAVDRSEARLQRLRRNAARLGLPEPELLVADATRLLEQRPQWRGWFDAVLLDAPCSGLGTLARHADARWRLAPEQISELAQLQAALLAGLAPLLRPGGRLLYATCTLHPAENTEPVAAFLASHPGWRQRQGWQRWPGDDGGGGDGFFAALLQAPGNAADLA